MADYVTALANVLHQIPNMENKDRARKIEQSLSVHASPQLMVKMFHEMYEMPRPSRFTQLPPSRHSLRLDLIVEEVNELIKAAAHEVIEVQAGDIREYNSIEFGVEHIEGQKVDYVEVADGLADIVYVCFGYAIEMGIDLMTVLREVHASNMTKLDESGRPIFREDGKVLKGPNYQKPNISVVIQVAKEIPNG